MRQSKYRTVTLVVITIGGRPRTTEHLEILKKKYCLIAQQNFEMSQAKFWRKSLSTMSIKTLAEDFQLGIHLEIIWMLLDFKVNSI